MTEQIKIAAHYTSIGMLTRTDEKGKSYVWYVVGFDGSKSFVGRFADLQQMVRQQHGESVEREVLDAQYEIERVNDR